jgi:hypothetical protein
MVWNLAQYDAIQIGNVLWFPKMYVQRMDLCSTPGGGCSTVFMILWITQVGGVERVVGVNIGQMVSVR